MKTWKTITLTALTTSTIFLGGYGAYYYIHPQPYQGEVFNNKKSSEPSLSTSISTPNREQNTRPQVGTTPALQPTFEIKHTGMGHDAYGTLIDTYTVIHRPTGDKVYKAMNEEQAKAFCNYMEQIAHGKEKLDYSMTQNFELWCTNYWHYQ